LFEYKGKVSDAYPDMLFLPNIGKKEFGIEVM
jgi:hypothetical protein